LKPLKMARFKQVSNTPKELSTEINSEHYMSFLEEKKKKWKSFSEKWSRNV